MVNRKLKHITLAITCCLLASCSSFESDQYSNQALTRLDSIKSWQQSVDGGTAATGLLDLIPSDELHGLIGQALESNTDVNQAFIALEIAKQSVKLTRGEKLPSASLEVSRTERDDDSTNYESIFGVSWTLDIWGRQDDLGSASKSAYSSAIAQTQYTKDIVASAVIDLWLRLIQQYQIIAIERQRLAVLELNEETIVENYRKGFGDLSDLDSARSNSSLSRSSLSAYEEELNGLNRAMGVLIGGHDFTANVMAQYPDVVLPVDNFPTNSLGRRPDLQQSYLEIRTAENNTAAAYKALLPSLSLQFSLSDRDRNLSDALFSNPTWTALQSLTMPIFQGGQLRAQAERAKLETERSYWAFQENLLNAVLEVENALGQEVSLTEQEQHINDALENAHRNYQTHLAKYRQGLVSFLDLLIAQREIFNIEIQKSQTTYLRLSNRIKLGLALGLGV